MIQSHGSYIDQILDIVPENEKLKLPYLKGNVDRAIADLFRYYKRSTIKAYELYHGRRRQDEFSYLTDNYGVGTPHLVPNMRLMGRRISALIGKQLQNQLDYSVTASDEQSVFSKLQTKRDKILQEIQNETKNVIMGQNGSKNKVFTEDFIADIQEKFGDSWKSDLEIAVHDYMEYYVNKKKMQDKMKDSAKHLFISGEMYNRVYVNEVNTEPEYWDVDPREFTYEKNPNSKWIRDSKRCVYRRFMTPTQIFKELGPLMTKNEREIVAKALSSRFNEYTRREVLFREDQYTGEDIALSEGPSYQSDLIEVFHVEWVATNEILDKDIENDLQKSDALDLVESGTKNIAKKARYREDLYEGYKIEVGGGMYIGMGKSKFIPRSVQDPYKAHLTYDGLIFNEEKGEPYSMVIATKELSDLYDITHYHLNNLFASIRPGGTYTIVESLPGFLGNEPEDRMKKAIGYEKTLGTKIFSATEEGMEDILPLINTLTNYPTNMDGQVLQAYMSYIEILEQQADRMLGLNPRMLGEMEERDGKSTTMQAIQQGEIITKEMFHMISMFTEATLERVINMARLSHKQPVTRAYMQGTNYRTFSLIPEEFSISDFNVFILDDRQEIEGQQIAKEFIMAAMNSQALGISDAFKAFYTGSLSRKIQTLEKADKKVMTQLQDQLQQLNQQLEEVTQVNEQLSKRVTEKDMKELSIKEKEMMAKVQEVQAKQELEERKLDLREKELKDKFIIDQKKIEMEALEFYDTNPHNDEFRNDL